jgi:hypothetical protein
MSSKGGDVGTSQRATRAQQLLRKEETKKLEDNIEIPEVPIPRRILIDHKKALAVIKQAEVKQNLTKIGSELGIRSNAGRNDYR